MNQLHLSRCNRYLFFAENVLPKKPIFIDVGSRTGIHAIALLEKFKSLIIVYEACAKNYHTLCQAVSGSTIVTHQSAVTGKDGEIDFFRFASASSNSIYPRHQKEVGMKLQQQTKVKSVSIESILTANDLSHIDILFCNCEGAELGIINEILSKPHLRNRLGQLCISFHGERIYPQAQTVNAIEKMSVYFLVITENNDYPCHLFVNKNLV